MWIKKEPSAANNNARFAGKIPSLESFRKLLTASDR